MRFRDVYRGLVVHILFLLITYLFLLCLRWLIPSISGEDLLYSKSLSAEELNQKRIQFAQKTINQSLFAKLPTKDDFEVRIVAADRRRGYLTQVIGYLLATYQPAAPFISICNVESEIFPELVQFQDKIKTFPLSSEKFRRGLLTKAIKKETRDYWECLQRPSPSRYVLLLEDDALIIPQFPKMMNSLVKQLDQRSDIDYVKLYHPNYLRKIPSIPLTIAASIALVAILHGFFYGRLHILFLPTTVILYVIIRSFNPQFMVDFRFYLTGSAYISITESCCTPAVVFRSEIKNTMAKELSQEESYEGRAKDHILDESRFIGRQSDGNWVVHIGAYSSVRDKEVKLAEKYSVWQQNEALGWKRYFL